MRNYESSSRFAVTSPNYVIARNRKVICHCEERSDEAISRVLVGMNGDGEIATSARGGLAMT